ncbi:hypothetical protein QE422_001942 [Chryseobacterium sp. SORGH_AS 447]|uniref:hypothetical protein n=1 Tax=Chryseobacterium sp. SORGH_AS_0447 TaxID=3041769 RepID=UPI00278894B1|nr:hypothetical protein [Chryseobacterium sp. SORGH_AS_0447]MDQ1161574.1 hypothetical protein [Chryseobacterium sp. SORGH_AS_0447]
MKKFLISTVILLGLSMNVYGQRRPPAPPHPSKGQLVSSKSQELAQRYNRERKLILNHPLATKKMKRDQLRALNERYANEKRLLRSAK